MTIDQTCQAIRFSTIDYYWCDPAKQLFFYERPTQNLLTEDW